MAFAPPHGMSRGGVLPNALLGGDRGGGRADRGDYRMRRCSLVASDGVTSLLDSCREIMRRGESGEIMLDRWAREAGSFERFQRVAEPLPGRLLHAR